MMSACGVPQETNNVAEVFQVCRLADVSLYLSTSRHKYIGKWTVDCDDHCVLNSPDNYE